MFIQRLTFALLTDRGVISWNERLLRVANRRQVSAVGRLQPDKSAVSACKAVLVGSSSLAWMADSWEAQDCVTAAATAACGAVTR